MRDKLGLFGKSKDDKKLIDDLLTWMEKKKQITQILFVIYEC